MRKINKLIAAPVLAAALATSAVQAPAQAVEVGDAVKFAAMTGAKWKIANSQCSEAAGWVTNSYPFLGPVLKVLPRSIFVNIASKTAKTVATAELAPVAAYLNDADYAELGNAMADKAYSCGYLRGLEGLSS